MDWIEIIHIRAFSDATREKARQLTKEITSAYLPGGLRSVACWQRSDLDTDISIILRWLHHSRQQAYSPLGIQLAEDFSSFGWVTHSMWQALDEPAPDGSPDRS